MHHFGSTAALAETWGDANSACQCSSRLCHQCERFICQILVSDKTLWPACLRCALERVVLIRNAEPCCPLVFAAKLIRVFDGMIEHRGQRYGRRRWGDDRLSAAFTQDDCTRALLQGVTRLQKGVTSGAVNVSHFGVLRSLCRGGLGVNSARGTAGSHRIPCPHGHESMLAVEGFNANPMWQALMLCFLPSSFFCFKLPYLHWVD